MIFARLAGFETSVRGAGRRKSCLTYPVALHSFGEKIVRENRLACR